MAKQKTNENSKRELDLIGAVEHLEGRVRDQKSTLAKAHAAAVRDGWTIRTLRRKQTHAAGIMVLSIPYLPLDLANSIRAFLDLEKVGPVVLERSEAAQAIGSASIERGQDETFSELGD